jgi:hypothetical protein
MPPTDLTTTPVVGFRTLATILRRIEQNRLDTIGMTTAKADNKKLIDGFRVAFAENRRAASYLIAEALSDRGIPPCFRHDHRSRTDYTDEQKSDLLTFDLRWLRRWHPDHREEVRFGRSKAIFWGTEKAFFNEAEFASHRGTRSAWKIAKSLKLTEEQQLECFWLQSAPIAKRIAATLTIRDSVYGALQRSMQSIVRTVAYGDDDTKITTLRRFNLWIAVRYTSCSSPTKIAKKYTSLTGEPITPQVVSRQRSIINKTLQEMKSDKL